MKLKFPPPGPDCVRIAGAISILLHLVGLTLAFVNPIASLVVTVAASAVFLAGALSSP